VSVDVQIRDNMLVGHQGSLGFLGGTLGWNHIVAAPLAFPDPSAPLENALLTFAKVDHFGLIQFKEVTGPPTNDASFVRVATQAAFSLAAAHIELLRSLRPIYPLRGFEEWGSALPTQPAENVERLTLSDRSIAISSLLASNASPGVSTFHREMSQANPPWIGVPASTIRSVLALFC